MGWEWPTLSHHFVNIWILAAGIVGQPFLGLKLLAAAVRGASLGTKLCGAELGSGAAGGSLSWEVSECLISCCYRLLQVCIIASIYSKFWLCCCIRQPTDDLYTVTLQLCAVAHLSGPKIVKRYCDFCHRQISCSPAREASCLRTLVRVWSLSLNRTAPGVVVRSVLWRAMAAMGLG